MMKEGLAGNVSALVLFLVLLAPVACSDSAEHAVADARQRYEEAMSQNIALPWPPATEWAKVSGSQWAGPRPKRVIVLGIDTLRADHVQGFGSARKTTPNLFEIADQEGVRFTRTYAQSSWTLPSMTSVFTSLYPPQHGVEDRGLRLAPDVPTLAGAFAAQGWMTAGFVTHIYVSSLFGLDSGFMNYRELSIDWNYKEGKQMRADEVFGYVVPWVHSHRSVPFFLYVHLFDPHWDYEPPPPFDRAFSDPSYTGPADGTWEFLSNYISRNKLMSPADLEHLMDLYDEEILATDDAIGRFVEFLRAEDLWEDTLFIVLSDHGEEFQEHGSVHHIRTLYEEVLHVPLLIKPPGGRASGARGVAAERVRNVDIAPTVLEIAGLAVPPSFQGQSLVPLFYKPGNHRRAFAQTKTERWGNAASSLYTQRFKVIVNHKEGTDNRGVEIYKWAEDPGETNDLAPLRPKVAERLGAGLLAHIRELEGSRSGVGTSLRDVNLTEEQENRLRSLGYIQ